MIILKAFSKQLLGARYERVVKSLLSCAILYGSFSAAKIKVAIAPSILFLTAAFFTVGVMWQALHSSQNTENMMGMFMLPYGNRKFTFAYIAAFSGYTLITKSLLILIIFFAVQDFSMFELLTALLFACNACLCTAAWYSIMKQKREVLAFLWMTGLVLAVICIHRLLVLVCIVLISLGAAVLSLSFTDAYVFYQHTSAKGVFRHYGKNASVLVYILRYLLTNTTYLINTAGLCLMACLLPMLLGQVTGLTIKPLGFAILCLNTPICTLLSGSIDLEQAIRVLPRQALRFGSRYCLFLFCINIGVSSIYLCSWQLQHGNAVISDLLLAVLFALQSAIFSVLLEWLHPIRNWKIESDIWHSPRKYMVPLLMLLLAVFICTWPLLMWIWLCVLGMGCLILSLILKRL